MKLPSSLRALNYYNFRLYFFGQAISLIGTWMQRIAVSWLVYELTHSAFMLGLTGFVGQIPMLLLSPYAGAYVDRHSRYRTLLATQIASMIQAGLLAAMVLTGHNNIIGIIMLSFLLGIINAFDMPSRQSLMIVLVQNKKDLPNAIALNSSMVTLARLAGLAAAGILLSSFGEGICFLLNFLSFFAVLISLLLMKLKVPDRKKHIEPIWENLREGFVYIRRHGPGAARYSGSYTSKQLNGDANLIRGWTKSGRDVYVYFNNDPGGHAFHNAVELKSMLPGPK